MSKEETNLMTEIKCIDNLLKHEETEFTIWNMVVTLSKHSLNKIGDTISFKIESVVVFLNIDNIPCDKENKYQ